MELAAEMVTFGNAILRFGFVDASLSVCSPSKSPIKFIYVALQQLRGNKQEGSMGFPTHSPKVRPHRTGYKRFF
jgi:hypothetical protein